MGRRENDSISYSSGYGKETDIRAITHQDIRGFMTRSTTRIISAFSDSRSVKSERYVYSVQSGMPRRRAFKLNKAKSRV